MSNYKPTEHGGLREDGKPDGRVGTGEFAHGQVDPQAAGQQGGQTGGSTNSSSTSSGEKYKPSEHGGLREDGQPDGRVGTGEFGEYALENPFAEGTYRWVAKGKYTSGPRQGQACVTKWFKTGVVFEEDYFELDIKAIDKATEIVNRFNDLRMINKAIKINVATVWEFSPQSGEWSGSKNLREPFIRNYQKFNSNSGWFDDSGALGEIMQALSHFSYHVTEGSYLLCDVQGGVYQHEVVLSDPVVLSWNRDYGVTDLGPEGIIATEAKVNFDGYHVYSITGATPQEVRDIEERFAGYYTTHDHRRNAIEVAVPPNEVRGFNELGLSARLLSDDLGRQIRDEDQTPTYKRSLHERGDLPALTWFDTYHPYNDHLQYWDDLVEAFPNNTEKVNIGPSYEGRDIYAFNIWGNEGERGSKPVILWHATVHAREWISTMVIEYLAYQLIDGYRKGAANVTSFLDHYDFWLVPFHNPDGFVYTQTINRLWRKNRQPRANTTCIGTDNNRNWKYQWSASGGSSPDPCSETYRGKCPGDTPENIALDGLSKRVATSPQGIRSFIDWHSYAQQILIPYGWTCEPEELPETLPRMREVARGTAEAIAVSRNTSFEYGLGCEILYLSNGNSRDHHHGVYNASHSWTLELSPQTQQEGGFVLPPRFIWPVVREQWDGQQWLLSNVREG
ncbi:Metallocarboxypeptidase A [Paramyrothecium foliicola]|nr:Metallocarboxypeptidase A [Paramyrothecium foliicola]